MTAWNKLTKRELEDWEKSPETNNSHFMWVGELPEIGEEVLVYTENSGYIIDKMLGIWGGLNFINNQNEPVIYWSELPDKPDSEVLPFDMESLDIEELEGVLEETVNSLKVITAGEYTKCLEQEKNNEA